MTDEEETIESEGTISATVKPPHGGPWSFQPLNPTLAEGELTTGVPFHMESNISDGGVVVRFGKLASDSAWEVEFTGKDLLHAAQTVLPEEGREFVTGGEEE